MTRALLLAHAGTRLASVKVLGDDGDGNSETTTNGINCECWCVWEVWCGRVGVRCAVCVIASIVFVSTYLLYTHSYHLHTWILS